LSLRKRIKAVGKKVQERVKDVGRSVSVVAAKVVVPLTAVSAGAASLMFGPAVGTAVAGVGAGWGRYLGATAARKEGLKGTEARTEGRELSQRALKYGMMTGALGTGIAGGIGALGGVAGGGGVLGGLTGGISNIFGIGGGGGGALGQGSSFYDPAQAGESYVSGETYYGGSAVGGNLPLGGAAAGATFDWGGFATGVLGAGTKLGQAYLTPQQQQQAAQQQGTGGGFFQNLFDTTPGSGVDLPIVGEVPTGLLILGGVAVLALTAK